MRTILAYQVWAYLQKRLAPDGNLKKEAIAKRSKVEGLFVGAPSTAVKTLVSRVMFIPLRTPLQSNEEAEIVATPTAAPRVALPMVFALKMLVSAS